MNKNLWKDLQPHVIAIGIFLIVSVIYCLPALQGMVIQQHDMEGWRGMAQQSFEYKEKYGHFPLWTNSVFGGMPTFQIINESRHEIHLGWLHHVITLFLPSPASLFFLACVGMYILSLSLKIRSWIGVLISLAYSFSTYSIILVVVGHTTKFSSMGYAPALIAGIILLMQRRYMLGFIVTLIFNTLLFFQNHVQIAYYTYLIIGCLAVAFLIKELKKPDWKHISKVAGLGIVALVMGVLSYSAVLIPTYDYSRETMRGGRSELSSSRESDQQSKGLNREYAFAWSYGITETFTFIVPRIFGGSTGNVANNEPVSEFPEDTRAAEILSTQAGMSPEQSKGFLMSHAYWGPQELGTSAPVYFGAVLMVLFIAGLVFYKGWHKGWLLAATILGIFLAWGKNFPAFNNFMFDYFPFYNKFRAPSMSLIIPQLTMAVIAGLGLERLMSAEFNSETIKKFKKLLYITGAVAAVLAILYFTLDYKGSRDNDLRESLMQSVLQSMSRGGQPTDQMQQQASTFASSITNALKEDRKALYGADLLRSLAFIAITLGVLYAVVRKKLAATSAILIIIGLNLIDLLGVGSRYLTHNNYVEEDLFEQVFIPNAADLQIKQDTGYFRVFDQSAGVSPFNSSRASYHHNNVGGYHPAKLGLYNDLITHQLATGNMQVYNMLNTKYFIMDNPATNRPVAQLNEDAFGPVWLVKGLHVAKNADDEMEALRTVNLRDSAVIDQRELAKIDGTPVWDSTAIIQLVAHQNEELRYQFKSANDQFAVFSEIYYPNGWKAYIDGNEAEIIRVNYVLRGLMIPAGEHTIEFKFESTAFKTGDMITLVIGILSILIILAGCFLWWKDYKRKVKEA